MTTLEEALATLLPRDPSAEEIAKFYKIKEICGFSDHDSVWSLLVAFGHYEILYGDIAKNITEKTRELLAEHKLTLEATANAAEKQIRANLTESVSKTTREMANQVIQTASTIAQKNSKRNISLALFMSIGMASLCLVLVAWFSFSMGTKQAISDNAWLQTNEGQAARKLAQLNNVQEMMICPNHFQKREQNDGVYCLPYDEKSKKGWGWRIK
jgi:hypothetical protein